MKAIFACLMGLCWAQPIGNKYYVSGLMIWNVGQGQFVTRITPETCAHWDMGGEVFPNYVRKVCLQKTNHVYFSHWDWDHIGLAHRSQTPLPNLCLARAPLGPNKHEKWLKQIPACSTAPAPQLRYWAPPFDVATSSSNSLSQVWSIADWALIPGDSTHQAEKLWSHELAGLAQIRVLVLGHHGSHTSTSATLLKRLPHLQMAIASSRWARYHHPDPRVVKALHQHGVAVLKTEDWGSILIEGPIQTPNAYK